MPKSDSWVRRETPDRLHERPPLDRRRIQALAPAPYHLLALIAAAAVTFGLLLQMAA